MKQIEVSIMGQSYRLGCPEGGEALLARAVAAVDREMSNIRDGGKVRARERIAVLAGSSQPRPASARRSGSWRRTARRPSSGSAGRSPTAPR